MQLNRLLTRYLVVVSVAKLFLLAAPNAAGQAQAQGNLHDLFARLPHDMDMSVGCSSPDMLFEDFDTLVDLPFIRDIMESEEAGTLADIYQSIGEALELDVPVTTKEALFSALAIDPSRPFAMTFNGEGEQVCLALPYLDLDTFLTAAEYADSEPIAVTVAGAAVRAGHTEADGPEFWFANEGYFYLASSMKQIVRIAGYVAQPQDVLYGSEAFPDTGGPEIVALANVQNLMAYAQPGMAFAETLGNAFDQLAVAMPLGGKPGNLATVRLHKRSSEATEVPPPLELVHFLPEDALGISALRLSTAVKEFALTMIAQAAAPGQAGQIMGMVNLVTGTLGDQIAVATLSIDAEQPRVVVLTEGGSPGMLSTLIAISGATQASQGEYGGATLNSVSWGNNAVLYYAVHDTMIVAATQEADLKATLDHLAAGDKTAPLPEGPFAEANHAVIFVREAAIQEALNFAASLPGGEIFPANVDMELLKGVFEGQQGYTITERPTYVDATFHGFTGFGVPAAIVLPALARAREAARRASSQNNLKQMGLVCKLYANEHEGEVFPPLPDTPGVLMADATDIYPEYLSDPMILQSPGMDVPAEIAARGENAPAALIDDYHYVYLGHVVRNENELLAYADGYLAAATKGTDLNADYKVGDQIIYRLAEGVERFFVTDTTSSSSSEAQSGIILMMERPGIRIPEGGNVLYMDGHVVFIRWGTFPYTDVVWNAIGELDKLELREER